MGPQAHSIENCWVFLAQRVYEAGWEAKTEQQLIHRIESSMKEFDETFVESLLEGGWLRQNSKRKVNMAFIFYLNYFFA